MYSVKNYVGIKLDYTFDPCNLYIMNIAIMSSNYIYIHYFILFITVAFSLYPHTVNLTSYALYMFLNSKLHKFL